MTTTGVMVNPYIHQSATYCNDERQTVAQAISDDLSANEYHFCH